MDPSKQNKIFYALIAVVVIGIILFKGMKYFETQTTATNVVNKKTLTPTDALSDAKKRLNERNHLSQFHVALKCQLVEKKVEKNEEELRLEIEKMKRIGRKAEDANKFNFIKDEECSNLKFCDTSNPLDSIALSKKEFQTHIDGVPTVNEIYEIEKLNIVLKNTTPVKLEIPIKAWDRINNITAFLYNGKTYATTACKTQEEEETIKKKILAEQNKKQVDEEVKVITETKKKEVEEEEEKIRLEKKQKEDEQLDIARKAKEEREKTHFEVQKLE